MREGGKIQNNADIRLLFPYLMFWRVQRWNE